MTASESCRILPSTFSARLRSGVIQAALLLAVAIALWRPLRRLTWEAFKYLGEALDYSEEDVGGPDGAEALLDAFAEEPHDRVASGILKHPRIVALRNSLMKNGRGSKDGVDWVREERLAGLAAVLVDLLNHLLWQKNRVYECLLDSEGAIGGEEPSNHWYQFLVGPCTMLRRYRNRQVLDALLDRMTSTLMTEKTASLLNSSSGLEPFVDFSGGLISRKTNVDVAQMECAKASLHAADYARTSAQRLFFLRCWRLVLFWLGAFVIAWVAYRMGVRIWTDTWMRPDGEPFSFTTGISAWPAEAMRLLVLVLAICFTVVFSLRLKTTFWTLTRRFRLSLPMANARTRTDVVCAEDLWYKYNDRGSLVRRWLTIACLMVLYFLVIRGIYSLFGEASLNPVRGAEARSWHSLCTIGSLSGFLLLVFFTMEAAYRCRSFIEKLGAAPTLYPKATRLHFSRQMGRIDDEYLDEWIDLQMIAELTEQVGRMVYYPAGLVLLMLLARNSWWDYWSWPVWLMLVFALNFVLALASVVVLQRAAKEAKRKAEQSLSAKVKKLQSQVAPSEAQKNASQAENLLKEIKQLQRGAFVPFWENPVVGAVFLSSGGTTVFQLAIWLMNR